MFRNLILLVAIGIVIWLVRNMLKKKSRNKASLDSQTKNHEIKNIVQCKLCQVFIPEDKAIKKNKLTFCSQKHFDEWQKNK